MADLEKEFEYYKANQSDLAEKYDGKVLVIKDQTVIGVFATELEAVEETKKTHELGTFLIQKCERPEKTTPQVFHSRVAFK